MLAIKFKKVGKKKQHSLRVVVLEKRSKLDGRALDDLGWVNPDSKKWELNKERVSHWLSVGAQPTDSVHNLLVKSGVIQGPKIPLHKKAKVKEGESAPAQTAAAPTATAPKAEAPAPVAEAKVEAPAPEAKPETPAAEA